MFPAWVFPDLVEEYLKLLIEKIACIKLSNMRPLRNNVSFLVNLDTLFFLNNYAPSFL